jgi:hypothetical protein
MPESTDKKDERGSIRASLEVVNRLHDFADAERRRTGKRPALQDIVQRAMNALECEGAKEGDVPSTVSSPTKSVDELPFGSAYHQLVKVLSAAGKQAAALKTILAVLADRVGGDDDLSEYHFADSVELRDELARIEGTIEEIKRRAKGVGQSDKRSGTSVTKATGRRRKRA